VGRKKNGQEQGQRQHGVPVVQRRAERHGAHQRQGGEREDAFQQLPFLGAVVPQGTEANKQWPHHDDAKRIGGEPVQPSGQYRRFRAVKEDEAGRRRDRRERGPSHTRDNEPNDAREAFEPEVPAKTAFNQPGDQQGLAGIAEGKHCCSGKILAAQKARCSARDRDPDGDREARPRTDGYQRSGGETRSRPENGEAIRFGQEGQAELGGNEIGGTHRNGETDWSDPLPDA